MTIDLSRAQKIQIGVVAAILLTAGYMLYKGTRPEADLTIASWVVRTPVKINTSPKPIMTTVTVFACYDGRLKITEYPAGMNQNATFSFETDYRRDTFTVYQDPLLQIEAINDPYKRVLNFAAYSFVQKAPQGIFGRLALKADQLKAEKSARDDLTNAITLIDNGAQTGIIQPDLYKRVITALGDYRAKPGDSTKDAAKAVAAHKVVELAIQYINVLNSKKLEAIGRYVAAMDGMLDSAQKVKLAQAKVNMRAARRRGPLVAAAF